MSAHSYGKMNHLLDGIAVIDVGLKSTVIPPGRLCPAPLRPLVDATDEERAASSDDHSNQRGELLQDLIQHSSVTAGPVDSTESPASASVYGLMVQFKSLAYAAVTRRDVVGLRPGMSRPALRCH